MALISDRGISMNSNNYTSTIITVLGNIDIFVDFYRLQPKEKENMKTDQILAFCSDSKVLLFSCGFSSRINIQLLITLEYFSSILSLNLKSLSIC